eukprot:SAG11_NODE_829_length_6967_cov_7.039196_6_plen_218_part_00
MQCLRRGIEIEQRYYPETLHHICIRFPSTVAALIFLFTHWYTSPPHLAKPPHVLTSCACARFAPMHLGSPPRRHSATTVDFQGDLQHGLPLARRIRPIQDHGSVRAPIRHRSLSSPLIVRLEATPSPRAAFGCSGSDYTERLLEVMDAAQLPKVLGGGFVSELEALEALEEEAELQHTIGAVSGRHPRPPHGRPSMSSHAFCERRFRHPPRCAAAAA